MKELTKRSVVKKLQTRTRRALVKKVDHVFSNLVRIRDQYRCVRCSTIHLPRPGSTGTRSLHCSHYFSRRYMGTRWDFDNCDALCFGCHRLVESDKQGWYGQFKKTQLGPEKFQALEVKAYGLSRFSEDDLEWLLSLFTQKYKEIKKESVTTT